MSVLFRICVQAESMGGIYGVKSSPVTFHLNVPELCHERRFDTVVSVSALLHDLKEVIIKNAQQSHSAIAR